MERREIPRPHYEVNQGEKRVGEITSGTFSPTLKQGIALAYLPSDMQDGALVDVMVRNKPAAAKVTPPPFVPGSLKR
jgi:aminomethyltransferase